MSLFGYMRAPSMLFTALEESMAFSCKARWVQSRENLDCTDRPVGIARNAYYRYFPHPPASTKTDLVEGEGVRRGSGEPLAVTRR